MTEDVKCKLCGDLAENLHLTITGTVGEHEYSAGLCVKPKDQEVIKLRDMGRILGSAAASSLMKVIDPDEWDLYYDKGIIPS